MWPILIIFQEEYYKYFEFGSYPILLRISGLGMIGILVVHRFSRLGLLGLTFPNAYFPRGLVDAATTLTLIIFFLVAGSGYFTAKFTAKGCL